MKKSSVALLLLLAAGSVMAEPLHHSLTVEFDPATHMLSVEERIDLPGGASEFLLNANLEITESNLPLEKLALGDVAPFFGINSAPEAEDLARLARYRVEVPPEGSTFGLAYGGLFDFGLSDQKEEYTRGFRETTGIIGEEGVYLAGNGFWYPRFNDDLIGFTLDAVLPEGWHLISQGDGVSRGENGRAHWHSKGLVDEIYLTGGPLVVYKDAAGVVETLVYLRESDDALAGKYLGVTAQYIEMYRNLIGPYPYTKFALVENFWETGYGMPSFTLLGPTVIRFPFILHSSYPHEILHNWWGNSVFVDYESGNWCEGLTAYMADHLIQEQRGKGAEYRRGTLQKYRNYVREGIDFPLSDFRSRHSAATEAVGYGKALMGFHMLRQHLGDELFSEALVRFYREYQGKRASFGDIQKVCEAVSEKELDWFFEPWVTRPGAVSLSVEVSAPLEEGDGYTLVGLLKQLQGGEPLVLEVPIVLQTALGTQTWQVALTGRDTPFSIKSAEKSLALHVDPYFDLFRLLDPRETPASIGQIFGEAKILALLPSGAEAEELEAWKALMEGWQSDSHEIEIKLDSEIERLHDDRSIWILGRKNSHAEESGDEIALGDQKAPFANHSIVRIDRHPGNVEKAIGWLIVDPIEAFPGLGRKLKGQWGTTGSPLVVDLRPEGERSVALPPLPAGRHLALAELPPVFSKKKMAEHVAYLSSPVLEGRGLGSAGGDKAAAYVAKQYQAAGLLPGGDDGTYYQKFTVDVGPDGGPHLIANVVGYLPGSNEDFEGQSVVLGAHYDHLGLGWPDVHSGDAGKVHPGADDNASGVAVLLELARNMSEEGDPPRDLVFVAFGGEEAGRLGSKYFVENPGRFGLDGIRGMINLDTVGRLFDKPFLRGRMLIITGLRTPSTRWTWPG